MAGSGASPGGVSTVRLDGEVPRVEVGEGIQVRHVVGQQLMMRVIDLPAESAVPIDELEEEHIVIVTSGTVRVTQGDRDWDLGVEGVAMVRPSRGFALAAFGGPARCLMASTPLNVGLVRDLLDLEHADHGFD